ncbi:MAG TPA: cell envelope integrity protein TolA [Opitutales bacterium]|nr:cell envelope integrity protein TolA [Opitutales bacterium]
MSYALTYREESRAPLAFSLSVLLHGLLAALLVALVLFHPAPPPVPHSIFHLVAGPPSSGATGNNSSPGPADQSAGLFSPIKMPTPPPAAPEPAPAPQPQNVTPMPPTPTPPAPTPPQPRPTPSPRSTAPVSPRGTTRAAATSNKIMSAADWLKQQQSKSSPTRGPSTATRAIPKVGVDVSGIVDNINGIASRSGRGATRAGGATSQTGSGDNGTSDDYNDRLIKMVHDAFVAPPASTGLSATIRLVIGADGNIISKHILVSSGDDRFDSAVRQALARVSYAGVPPGGEQVTRDLVLVPETP